MSVRGLVARLALLLVCVAVMAWGLVTQVFA